MGTITLTNTLTNGTTADADEVMANFTDITDVVNGSIDGDNISSSSALTCASLTTSGAITSTVATGTAPMTIASTTAVSNLNVDKVDGYDMSSGMADKTRTIAFTAAGAIPAASNGANQNLVTGTNFMYYQLGFDKDTDESAYWVFPCPTQYDGSNVVFTVKYVCASVTSGTVVFVITTESMGEGDTWDNSLSNTVTFSADTVPGTAGQVAYASKTGDPGWVAGETTVLRLYRDVSEDNAAEDIDVLEVTAEWEVT